MAVGMAVGVGLIAVIMMVGLIIYLTHNRERH